MSQSTLLQDVVNWDEKMCKEKFDATLPHLISDFTDGGSTEYKLQVLKTMTSVFVPVISICDLQERLLASVLPQMLHIFDEALINIQSTLQKANSDNVHQTTSLIQYLTISMDIVDHLLVFVNYASKPSELRLECVSSLPKSVVHVVRGSFEHCKVSNTLYGDYFQDASEHLMNLFKKSHKLQKALMTLMDLLPLNADTPAVYIDNFIQVCEEFHEVCCIIGQMDSTLMVATWKFLVKLITKHKELVRDKLNVSEMVSSLCSDIQVLFDTCLQQAPHPSSSPHTGDVTVFQRTLKICHLCAKMLVHLLKEYKELAMLKSMNLYLMIIKLYSKSSPSLPAPDLTKQSQEDIKNSLLVCIEPILQLVCNERHFCEAVTRTNNDIGVDHAFAQCMLLVTIMKHLPSCSEKTQAMWLAPIIFSYDEPRGNILETLFTAISECYSELVFPVELPGIMCGGKPQENVTLHEYLVTNINGFVASIKAQHFHIIESVLITWCLCKHSHAAFIAIDVWCFLARYSNAEVCNIHVKKLLGVLNEVPVGFHSIEQSHLELLIARLVQFMAPSDQAELLIEFQPSKCPRIWSCLPILAFREEMQRTICHDLISLSNQRISDWLDSQLHDVNVLCCPVALLSNICKVYELSPPPVSKQLHSLVIEIVDQLWFSLDIEPIKDHYILILLIQLSSHVLLHLKYKTLRKVLDQLNRAISIGAGTGTRLMIVTFLGKMGKLVIPDNEEHEDILLKTAGLFSSVLSDSCYIVHQQALTVFSVFAEETVHESVVTDSLVDEHIQANVVQFLNLIPYAANDDTQTEIDHLNIQGESIKKNITTLEQIIKEENIVETEKDMEPSAKRCKAEHEENKYQTVMTQLRASVSKLQALKQESGSLPSWFQQDMNELCKQLQDICR